MPALADPSNLTAVTPTPASPAPTGDEQVQEEPTGVTIDGIGLAVAPSPLTRRNTPAPAPVTARITWEGWNKTQFTERTKAGLEKVAEEMFAHA